MRSLSLLLSLLVFTALRAQVVIPEGAQNHLAGTLVLTDSFTNKGQLWLGDSSLFNFSGSNWQESVARNTYGSGLVRFTGKGRQQVLGSLQLFRLQVSNRHGVYLGGRLKIDSSLYLETGTLQGKDLYTEAATWVVRTGGHLSAAPQGQYNVAYPLYQPLDGGPELEGTGLGNVRVDNIAGISVRNNLNASGTVSGMGSLVFAGSNKQTLKADAGFSLGQLFVQNAAGLGLLSSGAVTNVLRLDGGKLLLNKQTLTLAHDAAIEGFSPERYIVAGTDEGRLRSEKFTGSMLFPIGTPEHYLPVMVTQTEAAPFSLGLFEGLTTDAQAGGAPIAHKQFMVNAVWIAEASKAGATMRMEWARDWEGSSFSRLGNEQIGLWAYQVGWHLRNTQLGVDRQQGTLTAMVAGKGRYTIGVRDSVAALLDISLQGKVVLDGSGISLHWRLNPWRIRGGTIFLEHSTDGIHFRTWHQTVAVGLPLYTHVHEIPVKGLNYYRVVYEGSSGVKVYSNVAVVSSADNHDHLEVFPNPTTGPLTLRFLTPNEGPAPIRVYNMLGQLLHSSTVPLKAGVHNLQTNLAGLPAGMYLVQVRNVVVKVERVLP